jgi:hypothetical protein
VYFYHPEARVVTNDDIRIPKVLDAIETYIATYPFCDLVDGMELLVPHDPQPNEHMFSLVVNHISCMAGYNLEEVMPTEGMDADHGAFTHDRAYTSLSSVHSKQTAENVLELP